MVFCQGLIGGDSGGGFKESWPEVWGTDFLVEDGESAEERGSPDGERLG